MGSAGVSDPMKNGLEQKRQIAFLLLIVSAAAVLRIVVAYHGGIWADEGFFLRVVDAPSWQVMLDFLRFHESHPPFFYALMRVWREIAGSSDMAALILPVTIGIAIVPAVFVFGKRVFSMRAAMLAAILAAICSALIEFSTQLRPYGLLPLLVLVSSWALAEAIAAADVRRWIVYVVSTLLMLYTHNWSWLVVFGQVVAVLSLSLDRTRLWRPRLWRELLVAGAAIAIGFSPWLTTLLFQMRHAGHPPLVVAGFTDAWQWAAFATPSAIAMALFGTLSSADVVMVLAALVLAIAAAVMVRVREDFRHVPANGDSRSTGPEVDVLSEIGMRVFMVVPVAAILAVVALSSRTNLLLPRCLAMLAPLLILAIAGWIDRQGLLESGGRKSPISAALLATIVTISLFADVSLLQTTRSNVRDVASSIAVKFERNDLVIVIPEWYGASFAHYFSAPVEEIDYPHAGKSGMVDFANVFARVSDTAPLDSLTARINEAASAGRRVWLITGRAYVRPVSPGDSVEAFHDRQSPIVSALRVQEIRADLKREFGDPDTTAFTGSRRPRYDEILPYLYAPKSARSSTRSVGAR